jgi:hypothetical protein
MNMRKIFASFLVLASILVTLPALANENVSSTQSNLTPQQKIEEAQKKLLERFEAAKAKLQERLTALQTKQTNQAASVACVGLAVNNRESAVGSAQNAYSVAQSAALTTRAAALNAAWSEASTTPKLIKTAVDKAWASYRTTHKAAVTTHNQATKAAWDTFRAAVKTCKASQSGVSADVRGYGVDQVQ